MDPRFRTVALVAAALGLLVSLFFALRPSDDDEAAPPTTVATTTVATTTVATTTEQITTTAPEEPPPPTTTAPTPTTTGSRGPGTIRINYTVSGGQPEGGIARDSIARGRNVVMRVTSDVADHVHLHGYDLMADVGPAKPATIRFRATIPGRFEVELEDRGLQIAELEVRP